ncbi:NAD(P)H-dependent glycerol-3-phosphate dehydrogenase [Acidobacterium sp. S8]|uniref:NAD(P)H-dependent glycerol-3-phosphate dehydrogenase n=1 Tax=Acidobacterium sp. S8 TaxID=1641854 RepID=UPI00131AB9E4|nr:NAD(P)H-dependent glycerol-3-phosphate dehydrogenase [Acidobacterium sp. S8]
MSRIAIMGSGAWGTAIAVSLASRGGHDLTLWSHSPDVSETIAERGENTVFLPGIPVPRSVRATSNIEQALGDAEIVVSVMPSHHVRASYEQFAPFLRSGQMVVSATKGLEDETLLRVSEVIAEVIGRFDLNLPIGVLSGPSFAQEVAAGFPAAVTIASKDADLAACIQREFGSQSLRLYTNEDVVGVELGGALKNVIAIAAGIVSGLGLGHNSAAALITRGIVETTRLAVACGGHSETLAGLSGIGDLVLTCTGSLSRNRTVGIELGKGRKLAEVLAELRGKVAEGVRTTSAALGLARRYNVEMPITEQVSAILYDDKPPFEAMRALMSRPGRDE